MQPEDKKKLKAKNWAVLAALVVFMAVIYSVTVIRIQAGLDAGMERDRAAAESATGANVPAQAPVTVPAADFVSEDEAEAATVPEIDGAIDAADEEDTATEDADEGAGLTPAGQ